MGRYIETVVWVGIFIFGFFTLIDAKKNVDRHVNARIRDSFLASRYPWLKYPDRTIQLVKLSGIFLMVCGVVGLARLWFSF